MLRRLLIVALLAGCSSPGGGPDGGGDAGLPATSLAQYCASYPARLCGLLEECSQIRTEERALCERIAGEECVELQAGARSGRYRYDGVAASRCLASLSTCLVVPSMTAFDCRDIFRAPDFFGSTCGSTDCDAGTYCDPNCERCRPWRKPGETCLNTFPMGFEAICDPELAACRSDDGGVQRCQPYPAVGEACPHLVCARGSFCSSGVCRAVRARGIVCTDDGQCADGLCNSNGTCGAIASGVACGAVSDCGKLACVGFVPGRKGTCQPRIPTGASCVGGGFDDGCEDPGATCLSGRCVITAPLSLAEGAECDAQFKGNCQPPYFCGMQCKDGLTCRADAGSPRGSCGPRLASGAPCRGSYGECASGLGCVSGKCQPLGVPGSACEDHRGCKSLLDCVGVGDGGRECRTWATGVCEPDYVAQPLAIRHGQCMQGYCAKDGGCEAKLPAGALCAAGQACAVSQCTLNPGSSQWSGTCPLTCN